MRSILVTTALLLGILFSFAVLHRKVNQVRTTWLANRDHFIEEADRRWPDLSRRR